MINSETFKKLNTEKFNLLEKVYQQNVKLNNLLENVKMRLDTHEKKLSDITQPRNQPNEKKPLYGCSFKKFLPVDCDSGWYQ